MGPAALHVPEGREDVEVRESPGRSGGRRRAGLAALDSCPLWPEAKSRHVTVRREAPDLLRERRRGSEPWANLAGVSVRAGAVRTGAVRAVGDARFSKREELSRVTSDQ